MLSTRQSGQSRPSRNRPRLLVAGTLRSTPLSSHDAGHQQLIGLLAQADPGFVAGHFATTFRSGSALEGETGSFRYFPGGFWEVTLDGGGWFLEAPWGGRVELKSGLVEEPAARAHRRAALHGLSCCCGTQPSWAGKMMTGRQTPAGDGGV